jgi:hypothetical protein
VFKVNDEEANNRRETMALLKGIHKRQRELVALNDKLFGNTPMDATDHEFLRSISEEYRKSVPTVSVVNDKLSNVYNDVYNDVVNPAINTIERSANPNECCENGDFYDDHECMKQDTMAPGLKKSSVGHFTLSEEDFDALEADLYRDNELPDGTPLPLTHDWNWRIKIGNNMRMETLYRDKPTREVVDAVIDMANEHIGQLMEQVKRDYTLKAAPVCVTDRRSF